MCLAAHGMVTRASAEEVICIVRASRATGGGLWSDLAAGRADLAAEDPQVLPVRHGLVGVARRRAAGQILQSSASVRAEHGVTVALLPYADRMG